jgi:hypothetical protein
MTLQERRLVAAYLLDRADQYETESPCWVGLADAAQNVMAGAVEAAEANGDFDDRLLARVDGMAGDILSVDATLGVEDSEDA